MYSHGRPMYVGLCTLRQPKFFIFTFSHFSFIFIFIYSFLLFIQNYLFNIFSKFLIVNVENKWIKSRSSNFGWVRRWIDRSVWSVLVYRVCRSIGIAGHNHVMGMLRSCQLRACWGTIEVMSRSFWIRFDFISIYSSINWLFVSVIDLLNYLNTSNQYELSVLL